MAAELSARPSKSDQLPVDFYRRAPRSKTDAPGLRVAAGRTAAGRRNGFRKETATVAGVAGSLESTSSKTFEKPRHFAGASRECPVRARPSAGVGASSKGLPLYFSE